jgi:hypothetical protein
MPVAVPTALVNIHPGTPGLADASSQELGAPEPLDVSDGKGKENVSQPELGPVGKMLP